MLISIHGIFRGKKQLFSEIKSEQIKLSGHPKQKYHHHYFIHTRETQDKKRHGINAKQST